MNKEKTGKMIRQARIDKGYTQSELGDMIGVSNKAISRWENGETFPDIGVIEPLAQMLELRVRRGNVIRKNRRFVWSKAMEAPVSLWRSMMCSAHRNGT